MNTRSATQPFSRRHALRIGALGLTGLTLSGFLRLSAAGAAGPDKSQAGNSQPNTKAPQANAKEKSNATADSVIFINLAGGPSHLDTLDMKPAAPAETRGEFGSIDTRIPGLSICEHLPKLAAAIDQFALIRGILHSSGSHPQGQSYISTGNRPSPAVIYPSYGSVVAKELPGRPDLPPYIAIPQTEWNAGYLGDAFAPFKTNATPRPGQPFAVRGITLADGVTAEKVTRRNELLKRLDRTFRDAETGSQLLDALDTFGRQAHSIILSSWTRKAFDVALEPASIQKLFAADELSQSLLLAQRLIRFGVKFITINNPGWDTHLDNFTGHRRLLPPLDGGLTALLNALREQGTLERTLVIAMGEFGRTPKINANVGRDHYPRANWCLMSGGGVRVNQLIGGTDTAGTGPDDATDLHPDDIGAALLRALGIDPQMEYHTRTGRPVQLIPHGREIDGLMESAGKGSAG